MNNMNTDYKDIITTFVLNTILHHVVMSWIIETREQLKYDIYENDQYQIISGPWYNTYIRKKLHGTVFEEFIRNAITDRYNLIFLLVHMNEIISVSYCISNKFFKHCSM